MRVVYKYQVNYGHNLIEMEEGAEIVEFALRGGKGFVWVVVDPAAECRTRSLFVVHTGEAMNDAMPHLGTAMSPDLVATNYVAHLFDGGWL